MKMTLYVKCSTAELSGRAFKPTPKAESFTRTAPLFYQLHRGAIAAPSQSAEDLKSERGLPTPGGPPQPHHWIKVAETYRFHQAAQNENECFGICQSFETFGCS